MPRICLKRLFLLKRLHSYVRGKSGAEHRTPGAYGHFSLYEVDPLTCSSCGKKIKIIAFVTHAAEIRRILSGIGWPTVVPEFDPYAEPEPATYESCDLVPGTKDGFPEIVEQVHYDSGPDPPSSEYIYPPHCEYECDPPHWEE